MDEMDEATCWDVIVVGLIKVLSFYLLGGPAAPAQFKSLKFLFSGSDTVGHVLAAL